MIDLRETDLLPNAAKGRSKCVNKVFVPAVHGECHFAHLDTMPRTVVPVGRCS